MRIYILSGLVISSLLLLSCKHSGIIDGADVRLLAPEERISLNEDAIEPSSFDVYNPAFIQICSDTILVVQEIANEDNPCYFKSFSTRTSDYLGSFLIKGRGPGEMIFPHTEKMFSKDGLLRVTGNGTNTTRIIDVSESLSSDSAVFKGELVLPNGGTGSLALNNNSAWVSRN